MSKAVYALATQTYNCTQQPICDDIVLLHGWGGASNSWLPLISALQNIARVITLDLPGFGASETISEFGLDAVVDLIAAQLPEQCVLIGWSLGGMLAVQLAAAHHNKISRIITLATNVKFVASRDYETAMPLVVNRQFNKDFAADAQEVLKLFSGLLAQGDSSERVLRKQIRLLAEPEKINLNWLQALVLLSELDNRKAFASLTQQGLHILAEKDVLVPVVCSQQLAILNPQQQVHIVPDAAHAVHWSQPELVLQLIRDFLQMPALDKKQIAHSFSRAAATYDSVASLQRDVGTELLKKWGQSHLMASDFDSGVYNSLNDSDPIFSVAKQVVLDLGCGTGYFTPKLQERFPQATMIGVDIAEGMLQFARSTSYKKGVVTLACRDPALDCRLLTAGSPVCCAALASREDDDSLLKSAPFDSDPLFACADAESLPFADQSVDIIYSNFALQWCANLPRLFAELQRVLKSKGQLIFTTLGPETLHELKSAWQQVDNRVHVNQFHERDLLLTHLQQQGFAQIEFEHKPVIMEFEHLSDLTRSLKALGAQNVNRGRATGLTGRKKIQAFKQAYENFRSNNLLPATYDVFYVKAKKI